MDSFIFDIAGFIIKIDFEEVENKLFSSLRKDIKNGILENLGSFAVDNKRKPDLYIKLKEKIDFHTLFWGAKEPGRRIYLHFFDYESKNRIVTYYYISVMEFQFILHTMLSVYLAKNHGFMIHSSAIALDDKAYLFLGVSGSGKSTTASLLRNSYSVLGDDMGIIKKEKGIYYYYQSPFMEKESWIKKHSAKYKLGKIFLLKKSNIFRAERLTDKNMLIDNFLRKYRFTRFFNPAFEGKKGSVEYAKIMFDFVGNFNDFYHLYFAKNREKLEQLIGSIK